MKKVYKPLTEDQKARGVIFSSKLGGSDTVHEVTKGDPDMDEEIRRLKDDKFFNDSSFTHNEIRR